MKINASRRLKAYSYDTLLSEDHIERLIYDDFKKVQHIYRNADKIEDDQEREEYIKDSLQNIYEDPELFDEYFAYKSLDRVISSLLNNSSDSRVVSYLREKLDLAF